MGEKKGSLQLAVRHLYIGPEGEGRWLTPVEAGKRRERGEQWIRSLIQPDLEAAKKFGPGSRRLEHGQPKQDKE